MDTHYEGTGGFHQIPKWIGQNRYVGQSPRYRIDVSKERFNDESEQRVGGRYENHSLLRQKTGDDFDDNLRFEHEERDLQVHVHHATARFGRWFDEVHTTEEMELDS